MTQVDFARRGEVTEAMAAVAEAEGVSPEAIRDGVGRGTIVIPLNANRKATVIAGIGKGLSIKVNANVGTSPDYHDIDNELAKCDAAVSAGAHSVMDLSTGGDLREIRNRIMEACPVMIGTVPVYQIFWQARLDGKRMAEVTADDFMNVVREHARQGVDFVTVHCGVNRDMLERVERSERTCGVVSRGGTFLLHWMKVTGQENPFYQRYDELLEICREVDMTLSLGDGLRPGAGADSFDELQLTELQTLGRLTERARGAAVQVIVEGPGHVPMHEVTAQVRLQKAVCHDAPFYVLGPLVTDIAPGYDHIAGAIGGAIAGAAGVDFLCYLTPTEHLGLPGPEHVREGVVASRIAAHAADIANGLPGAAERDRAFSTYRRRRNWDEMMKHCLDPVKADQLRAGARPQDEDVCSMCGEFCVFKIADEANAYMNG
ncbi:MAG: phosphomethylpyrimidine synthase ThiC [Planctomycetota bacterium]